MSTTLSWGANPPTPSGLESNLWGGISTSTSSSVANSNSTWGSGVTHTNLPASQGHNMQVGASSGGDGQSSNGSASAGGWGMSMSQHGPSMSAITAQSQAGSLPSNNTVQQSGPSSIGSSQSGPFATNQMSWQGSKMFGVRDFPQSSESGWNTSVSSVISSNGSAMKDGGATIGGELDGRKSVLGASDALAAGLQNLAIDKSNPPPDLNWNGAKAPWNSGSMDAGAMQGAGIGNPADLSFAQAAQKGTKQQAVGSRPVALTAREEEIRRAIDTHDGWGSRPIRQDTSWDIETSPKTARKVSVDPDMNASNMWNNNNGTAIWEATREPQSASWQGGAAGGGVFGSDKEPGTWNMPPKPGVDSVGSWGGGNGAMSDKSIGTWGGDQQPSKLWGSKTETGSWNEPPSKVGMTWNGQDTDVGTWEDPATAASRRIVSGGGMSSGNGMGMGGSSSMNMGMGGSNNMNMGMGGAGMNMPVGGGGMNMPMGGNGMGGNGMGDSSLYWNDTNAKPQSWNPNSGAPRPKPDEPWNKAGGPGMGRQPGGSGWGDPSGAGQKVDDGTSIWAANAQEQARASGWGEPSAVWNPAVGARPKATSWGGEPDGWNMRKPGRTDEGPSHKKDNSNDTGWGDVEVGYWNDVAQESSSWTSAPTWKSGKGMMVKPGQQKFPGGSSQPQMRSKLIQQLMDMGFKKEEAQSALINNNMNFENALTELTSGMHKKDFDNDVFQPNGAKFHRPGFPPDGGPHMVGDDISDSRADSNPHVPNFPMQNTPFPNAQVPSQPYMAGPVNMYDRSKNGPPMPPASSSSINPNNLQHKLKVLHQQGTAAPGINSLNPTQGVVARGTLQGTNQTMVQQQAAQQQILQQLRLAVQSGLISPHLLNRQLPHNILVMLQQLLQLQNSLQNLVQRQQFLHQNKVALNIPRPQLEQVQVMINQCKTQIVTLQKQLEQAQHQMLLKEQPPPTPTPTPTQQSLQQMPQQPPMVPPPAPTPQTEVNDGVVSLPGDSSSTMQSRLTQWKRPTPDREGEGGDLNKAPGSKPLQHSHSTPTMGPFGDLTSLNIGGDKTWSSSATSTSNSAWPSTTTSDNTGSGTGESKSNDSTPTSSAFASIIGGDGSLSLDADVIPEFVPGKPWQGLSSKSVEDDPHITPGSISRSLSVNVVKDDYLNTLTSNKSSPTIGTDGTWSLGSTMSSTLGDPSPGGRGQWQGQGAGSFGRQNSWAGRSVNSAFNPVSSSGWDGRPGSSWLMMKNLTPQIDAGTLRSVCQQQGALRWFFLNSSQAIVGYSSKEEASKAWKALHGHTMANTVIHAQFLPEAEAMQLVSQQTSLPSHSTSTTVPPPSSQWGQPPSSSSTPSRYPWNSAPPIGNEGRTMWDPSLWDLPPGDQAAVPSLSNIFGGQM